MSKKNKKSYTLEHKVDGEKQQFPKTPNYNEKSG